MTRLVIALVALGACASEPTTFPDAPAPTASAASPTVDVAALADALGDDAPPAEMVPPVAPDTLGATPSSPVVLRPLREILPGQDAGATVQWVPVLPLSAIFPSYVLAYLGRPPEFAGVTPMRGLLEARMGDRDGLLGVRLIGVTPGQTVRLDIAATPLSGPSTMTTQVLHRTTELYPTIAWRADALRRHTSVSTLPVTVSVQVDGQPAGQRTFNVRVKSVNDSPRYLTANGVTTDLQDLFVGYVDETSYVLPEIRRDALDSELVSSFAGYQLGEDGVRAQVLALWHALQRRGLRYSSIADVSVPTVGVASQLVRRPAESLATAEANCIDGTVLMASLLLSVGIDPFIVTAPGHAYLGYFTTPADGSGQRSVRFLEMTMIDRADLRDVPRRRPGTLNPLTVAQAEGQSIQSFDAASATALAAYQQNRAQYAGGGGGRYRLIDVADVRRRGLIPIGEAR